jgi:hypothetical protein
MNIKNLSNFYHFNQKYQKKIYNPSTEKIYLIITVGYRD